jgi:hypothetical protein
MTKLSCTEPVCRHEWTEPRDPEVPRCPRCGGFWVRVIATGTSPSSSRRPPGGRSLARPAVRALG